MHRLLLSGLLLLLPVSASAHEGEAHGGTAAPAAPASSTDTLFLPKESQFLLGVRTEPVSHRRLAARTTLSGKVIPRTDRHAQIFAPVAGSIQAQGSQLPLIGTHVKKGQVLAIVQQSLSAPEAGALASGRIQAESAVNQAKATLEQTRRDLERVKSLAGVLARKEIQQAELAAQVAEQEYTRALRERELYASAEPGAAGGKLARFPLVSPLDGVLVEANATVGELVEPFRVLFTVLDPKVVWVEASVFPDDLARVEQVKEAPVKVEGYPDTRFRARLFHLGQIVEEPTRTVKAFFEVQNEDGRLRPGLFAEVEIGSGGEQEWLAVPDAAVVEVEGRKRVYVHVGPEAFVAREVQLGARDGEYHAVLQGLSAGERVVTRGTYPLSAATGGR